MQFNIDLYSLLLEFLSRFIRLAGKFAAFFNKEFIINYYIICININFFAITKALLLPSYQKNVKKNVVLKIMYKMQSIINS